MAGYPVQSPIHQIIFEILYSGLKNVSFFKVKMLISWTKCLKKQTPSRFFFGRNVSPLVTDLDNDGNLEMALGNESGGLKIISTRFSDTNSTSEDDHPHQLVYPSPAGDFVYIKALMRDMPEVFDLLGRKLEVKFLSEGADTVKADISHLRAGIYLIAGNIAGVKTIVRFVKI